MDTGQFDILLQSLQLELGTLVFGWLVLVMGLVLKDILSAASFGISFFLNPHFNEGDSIYFDGEECIIQKIGLTTTVLRNVENERWRFVRNQSIRHHKLEKKPNEFKK